MKISYELLVRSELSFWQAELYFSDGPSGPFHGPGGPGPSGPRAEMSPIRWEYYQNQ